MTDQSEKLLKEINSRVCLKECACSGSILVSESIRTKQTGRGRG